MNSTSPKRRLINLQSITLFMALIGFGLSYISSPLITQTATTIADLFVKLLRMISMPIIFLSIVSTIGGMKEVGLIQGLGRKTLFYTLLTTLMSASVALVVYLLINPAASFNSSSATLGVPDVPSIIQHGMTEKGSYWSFLLKSVPSDFVRPFLEGNVLGVLFLAAIIGFAMQGLSDETHRKTLHQIFTGLFALVLKMAGMILYLMPVAVASFIILFVKDLKAGGDQSGPLMYIVCVVSANLIQAFIILPTLLLAKKVNPLKLFKAMWPALVVGFFGKSSAAALPVMIDCAEKKANIHPKVGRFCFPLCSTINMNACAGFILITVLFVSMINGVQFSTNDLLSWVVVASIAAVGNAAVPMGCFFLASSFLATQNIPLHFMGVILPVYAILDMLETAINLWSDSCVTAIVNKEALSMNTIENEDAADIPSYALNGPVGMSKGSTEMIS